MDKNEIAPNIIDNSPGRELIRVIKDQFRKSKEAKFAIGYFFLSGFSLIKEDGLYPALKGYLADAVSEHFKPVDYDRWSKLYWKRELEGDLTPDEERELETLERENMKTIEKVYRALVGNREVQAWIERIKQHK